MDAVGLVEGGVGGHAVEKEGIERGVVFSGDLGKDAIEGIFIGPPSIHCIPRPVRVIYGSCVPPGTP